MSCAVVPLTTGNRKPEREAVGEVIASPQSWAGDRFSVRLDGTLSTRSLTFGRCQADPSSSYRLMAFRGKRAKHARKIRRRE